VIGTQLKETGVNILMIDPPPDEAGDDDTDHEHSLLPEKRPRKVNAREWRIPDSKFIDRAARNVSQAKILSYAASDEDAVTKIEQISPRLIKFPRRTPRITSTDENDFGRFTGIQYALPYAERLRVEVFQALEQSFRQAYIDDDLDRIIEESENIRKRIRGRAQNIDQHIGQTREQIGDTIIMRSLSNDGTLFEVRLTPS
jgi:hypothetical protein